MDSLYLLSEQKGFKFKTLKSFDSKHDDKIPRMLRDFTKVVLKSFETLSASVEGDYFLNTRNSQLQKLLRMDLYFNNDSESIDIIQYITQQCQVKSKSNRRKFDQIEIFELDLAHLSL